MPRLVLSILLAGAALGGGACERAAGAPAAGAAAGTGGLHIVPLVRDPGGAPHVALGGGPAAAESFAAADPCVVRIHGDQFTTRMVRERGGWSLPLVAPLTHDAVVGFSTPPAGSTPAQHHKAIVAAHGADGAPVPTTAVTARLGLLAELTPLLDPCVLGAGDTLPVRLAVDLGEVGGVPLRVSYLAPGEATMRVGAVRTRATGVAEVAIGGPGLHVIEADVQPGRLDGGVTTARVSLAFVAGGRR